MNYKLINGKLLLRENGVYQVKSDTLYVKDGKIFAVTLCDIGYGQHSVTSVMLCFEYSTFLMCLQ